MRNKLCFTESNRIRNPITTNSDNKNSSSWAMENYSNNLSLKELPSDINSLASRENIPWIDISGSPYLSELGDLCESRLEETLSKSLLRETNILEDRLTKNYIEILKSIYLDKYNVTRSTLENIVRLNNEDTIQSLPGLFRTPAKSIFKIITNIYRENSYFQPEDIFLLDITCRKIFNMYVISCLRWNLINKISEAFKNNSSNLEIKEYAFYPLHNLYPLPIYARMLKTVKKLTLSENSKILIKDVHLISGIEEIIIDDVTSELDMQPLMDIESLKIIRINHGHGECKKIYDIAKLNYDNLIAITRTKRNRLSNISIKFFLYDGREYRCSDNEVVLVTSSAAASTASFIENSTSSSDSLSQETVSFGENADRDGLQNLQLLAKIFESNVSDLIFESNVSGLIDFR